MLTLTDQLADLLLARLNEREHLNGWQQLLAGDDHAEHQRRQAEPYDTTFSAFHRSACEHVDAHLRALRADAAGAHGAALLGRWLTCTDAFSLSRPGRHSDPWIAEQTGKARALTACRIGTTVFYLPGKGRARWARRPWRGDADPLLTLPYQRKYDRERHALADELLRRHLERLQVARDLLNVIAERLDSHDVTTGGPVFGDLTDIKAELIDLGLSFGTDPLSDMLGSVRLELAALRREHTDTPRIDFTIAEGAYRGCLGGYHRRPSGALRTPVSAAGVKWMAGHALDDLHRSIETIIAPSLAHRD